MKIAMITPGYLPVPAVKGGAVEVLIQYLVEGNEKDKRCNIDLYTVDDCEIEKYKYNYTKIIKISPSYWVKIKNKLLNKIYSVFRMKKWRTSFGREVVKKISKEKYDYVVIHNNLMAYRDIYEKTDNKENLIYVLHNNIDDDENHVIIAKLIGKTAKKIISVSEYTKNHFLTIAKQGNVNVLHNCIDLNKYLKEIDCKTLQSNREKYGIRPNDFVFMYSGRIDKYKGVLELVKAFKKIKIINKKLLIVGKTWFGSENVNDDYIALLKEETQNIENEIIFTGFVKPENMPIMYKLADCLVIPSLWEEPFGVVALEGIVSKVPIIATNSGGLVEILDNGIGRIVEKEVDVVENLAKEMEFVKDNIEAAKLMADKGYNKVVNDKRYDKEYYLSYFFNEVI